MKESEKTEKKEELDLFKKRREWTLLSDYIVKETRDPEKEPDLSGSLNEYGRYIE